MTELLRHAMTELEKSRADVQDAVAIRILADLEDEQAWAALFDSKSPSARVQHLLGALDSGLPDLAEHHRAYIVDSLKRGG